MCIISNNNWGLKKILTEGTLFHALEDERIQREVVENEDATFWQKIGKGLSTGVISFVKSKTILLAINTITHRQNTSFLCGRSLTLTNSTQSRNLIIRYVILSPIVEEILFRGLLQNSIGIAQRIASQFASNSIAENRVFKWLISPSSRILVTNSIFALLHLSNSFYIGIAKAVTQSTKISLIPHESILYETTGSIISPIACHIMNNFLMLL